MVTLLAQRLQDFAEGGGVGEGASVVPFAFCLLTGTERVLRFQA